MGIEYQPSNIHWNYYLAIENDFEKISRYVEFAEDNNNTFSIEFARIIMASTQEIDGILKKNCVLLNPKKESKNINDYKIIIKEKCLSLINETVEIPRFGMSSKPWQSWIEGDDNPDWWRANNYIKHNRTQNFEKANLKNAFNSVGALLITTLYFYKYQLQNTKGSEIDWQEITSILKPRNSLFILNENYYSDPGIMKWGAREW